MALAGPDEEKEDRGSHVGDENIDLDSEPLMHGLRVCSVCAGCLKQCLHGVDYDQILGEERNYIDTLDSHVNFLSIDGDHDVYQDEKDAERVRSDEHPEHSFLIRRI